MKKYNEMILMDNKQQKIECSNPFELVAQLIKEGSIIAIKGIGGYHLCCNATDQQAVETLRIRKKRKHKPLAIMACDIQSVKKICDVSPAEKEVVTSEQRPIVLLRKKSNHHQHILPTTIAPGQSRLGVMLPYTDIHTMLFEQGLEFLVMTSANSSGFPTCYKDKDAFDGLSHIVDYYFIHNEEIIIPMDDSVVKVVNDQMMISRCGRSYAPCTLLVDTAKPILAVGAEQKGSICIVKEGIAYLSQYVGDIKSYEVYEVYMNVIQHMKAVVGINPTIYAYDLHPNYLSTQYAKKQQGICMPIQHHHAHMASCMGEHGLYGDVIGVIYDGTGLGDDETIWGGEFLVGSRKSYTRVGHLQYVTFQGGDLVVIQLWRNALCYLHAMGIDRKEMSVYIEQEGIDVIVRALEQEVHCFQSSSIGRLFDCIAALTGIRTNITYDAQGAIELESQIDHGITKHYPYEIDDKTMIVLGYESIVKGVLEDIKEGIPVPMIAAKFHNSIVYSTVECICKIRGKTGLNRVVLSGGVFENVYLLQNIYSHLQKENFEVYHNQKVPINDSGISYGQVVVASERMKE